MEIKPSAYGPFDVAFSSAQRQQINRWIEQSLPLELGLSLIAHFDAITEAIRIAPRDWGDPLYRLDHLKLIVYHRVFEQIHVTYGVHDRVPMVFIREIRLIMDHPLGDAS